MTKKQELLIAKLAKAILGEDKYTTISTLAAFSRVTCDMLRIPQDEFIALFKSFDPTHKAPPQA